MNIPNNIFFSCAILLLLTKNLTICAQINCLEESTKEKEVKKCFHENGNISSLEEWDKEHKWGKLTVYSANGKKIQDWELRKIHGIAKAELEYHKNGQVSKVAYSSAPDAGIQRFESVYYFNQEGKLTNTEKNDYPPKLSDFFKEDESIPQENQNQCAEIWISKLEIINSSKKTQKLNITPLLPNSLTKPRTIMLKPAQKATVDSCIQAQFFQDPINQTQINYFKSNKKVSLKLKETFQISSNQKTFIYELVN